MKQLRDIIVSMPAHPALPSNSNTNCREKDKTNQLTQLLLDEYPLTERDRVTALLLKVGGVAREIINSCGTSLTVINIIDLLTKTYGRDRSALMARAKQLTDEPVTVYLGRLKTTWGMLGMHWNTAESEPFFRESFVNGLLPSVGEKVKTLFPTSIETATSQAIQVENHNDLVKEQRKQNKANNIETIDKRSQDQVHAKLFDKVNALEHQLQDRGSNSGHRVGRDSRGHNNHDHNSKRFNQSRGRNHPYTGPPRPFNGTCFLCNLVGHRYTHCPRSSPAEIQHVHDNYQEVMRKHLEQKHLNSQGVATASQ